MKLFKKEKTLSQRMPGQNFIVINGIRYDAVKDADSTTCTNCDLFEKCIRSQGLGFCSDLFSKDLHFEVNENIHYVQF